MLDPCNLIRQEDNLTGNLISCNFTNQVQIILTGIRINGSKDQDKGLIIDEGFWTVTEADKIILSDDKVKAVLVNIFGGIVRCDLIADGIIGAVAEVGVNVPVVVRLEGNNAELGAKKLADSGLNIIAAKGLTDAAQQVVAAVEGK